MNLNSFELARAYREEAVPADVRLRERAFTLEEEGQTATKRQQEVEAVYFDQIMLTLGLLLALTDAISHNSKA